MVGALTRLLNAFLDRAFSRNGFSITTSSGRPAGHPAGRSAGRPGGAGVISGAENKKAFDRGGPIWPPRSNAKDGRSGWGPGGPLPALCPAAKTRFFCEMV